MKVLITGSNGQLGCELQKTLPSDFNCLAFDIEDFDITSVENIQSVLSEFNPNIVINAAAYTAVDEAEEDSEHAYKVNMTSVQNLIGVLKKKKTRLIHISTDFVFSGTSSTPYLPESPVDPICVYGKSKAEGERIILDEFKENSVILRTSWLYSSHGNNFVKTMLRLMKERESISVVSDQVGSPTWANGLAKAIWLFCSLQDITGIYHWSDAGVASWYDFACAIQEEAVDIGVLNKSIEIIPVGTSDYPTPAERPPYSVLDKQSTWDIIGFRSPHWRTSLREMLKELQRKN